MSYKTKTQIIKLLPGSLNPAVIKLAAEVLQKGGLVAFPTETVYGLGANAFDSTAIAHIFEAKERPFSDPLIVHIANISQLDEVAADVPPLAIQFAEAFWPGPLTLVLRRGTRVPGTVSAGMDTVAVRFPDHTIPQELIRVAGIPIAAPSANQFGRPSPTTAQHVLDDLNNRVDLILDGGPCPIGLESTVLNLLADPPEILRPGGLTVEMLRRISPDILIRPHYLASEEEGSSSPGMLLRHYSPNARLILVNGTPGAISQRMITLAQELIDKKQKVGVMIADEEVESFKDFKVAIQVLGPINRLDMIASNLFSAMRELDRQEVNTILVGTFSLEGLGLAIRDRLLRAADGRVIEA